MKKIFFVILWSSFIPLHAQTDSTSSPSWKHNLAVSVNLTQVAFTDWAQGGENSLAWALLIDGKSLNEGEDLQWTNTYKFAFGQTRLGSQGLRKTDDRIDFESILTYKLGSFLNPYAAFNVKSQFAPGFTYDNAGIETQVSNFFDPGYLTQSFGVGYEPMKEIKTRFGAAVREIITSTYIVYSDDPTTTDVEKTRVEGGLEWVTDISWQIDENIFFNSKIELFSPLKQFEETVFRNDNTFTAKINKYITTTLNVQMLNDKKVTPRTQFKETIALGLNFTIF